jgi:3-phosphoshikimate 1-carboxyvinyltransferase
MSSELRKMGADITELPDGMIIRQSALHGAQVNSFHDHRIAMALTVAALGANGKTFIADAECCEVTYPGFAADFRAMGAEICPA